MRILSVDTATVTCSVGILDDGRVLAEAVNEKRQTHSRHLMTMVDAVLQMAGVRLDQLDALAVTRGPGSFTGVRIGISTMQGLAMGLSKPLIGISSLEALAHQAGACAPLVCPVLDARKGEVYTAIYRPENDGMQLLLEEQVCSPDQLVRQIDGPCLLVGNGTLTYRKMMREKLGGQAVFAGSALNKVRAETVGRLAMQKIKTAGGEPPGGVIPHYIRPSDAEINLRKKDACR